MGGGIRVHLSDLHHGAAGNGGRARPLGAPAQLDRVVHHNIPLEQDGGGHERVALSTETHGAKSVYLMQGGGGEPRVSQERNKTVAAVNGCIKKNAKKKPDIWLLTFEKKRVFTRMAADFYLHNKT